MDLELAIFLIINGAFLFAAGAATGSFLNVCIYRMPLEKSIIYPPSHCPSCFVPIRFVPDNLPILSYLLLGGKCRNCKGRISPQYVLVELLMALVFLAFYLVLIIPLALQEGWMWSFMASPELIRHVVLLFAYLYVTASLIVVTLTDIRYYMVPDQITKAGVVVGLAASFIFPALHLDLAEPVTLMNRFAGLGQSVLGIVVSAGFIYGIRALGTLLFRKEAMGLGDAKLMAFIGAFVGWKAGILINLMAPFFGVVYGVWKLLRRGTHVLPYGPFLSLAAIVVMVGRDFFLRLVDVYVRMISTLL